MLSYKYSARDPATGQKVQAEVEAENQQTAAKLIRQAGLAPIDITLKDESFNPLSKILNKISTKDKILFSRQLSTLINAGMPLVQSLRNVASQTTSKPFKSIINSIINDVEAGSALSAALARHPKAFNQIYVSLVAAGEVSGTLDASLERLSNQQEKDAELVSKVRGALVYPIVVLGVMLVVVTFMIVKVLPQVEVLYEGIPGAQLPLVTRILLAVSHFATERWWAVILILGVAVFLTTKWARTFGGKRVIDKMKLRMWPIGPLFQKMYMARFARTGTTLVASGVPLIQVLEVISHAVNNVHIEESLKKATEKVKGGKALSDALTNDPNFLELVPNMLRIGEQSGAIEQMLEKTADYYEKEVDNQIKTISTIIEPVMMIILGIFAFIIVAAVLLPVYQLAGKTIIR